MPPADPYIPTAPFQAVASDFFKLMGKNYLLTVDRFSNWPDLREATAHNADAGADGLIKANRELFATFGVPEQLSSDGGPEYTSNAFQAFLRTWGVKHRLSSAYNPQSNGRAEVTVKSMKRLLRDNIDPKGKLNTDAVTRAILQIRNTPESDSGLSPAQILLGRTLRDTLPLQPPIPRRTTIFDDNSAVSRVWKDVWSAKEHALKARLAKQVEKLEAGSHELRPLDVGDTVRVQNQTGTYPKKWDRTGIVMQVGENDQYIVRVDGSRRLTLRNRRFLRKMIPHDSAAYVPQPLHEHIHVPTTRQSRQPDCHHEGQIPPLLEAPESPQIPLQNLPPAVLQDPPPPTTSSLLPVDQPTPPASQHSCAPGQENMQSIGHQVRRAPGSTAKQKMYNFSMRAPVAPPVAPPSLPAGVNPQQGNIPSSPALESPRPQRTRRQPDWYVP